MNVLVLLGSSRKNGNTAFLLGEIDLRVSYSTCSTRYPHIREDAAACKGAFHAGRIVSF